MPALAGELFFETIPADHGSDVFEMESRDGKIVLRGNSGVALASALNRYLEEFAHCDIFWNCGDQLAVPNPPPVVARRIRVVSLHRFRYAYNFCTHGYRMAWWDWPQWERELDFLAADPFYEGGKLEGIDLAACGRAIHGAMLQSNRSATWVLQSWEANPRQPMIDALEKSKLLVLDLHCEGEENWRRRDQFGHTPWLWCTIQNWGGNVGLGGDLDGLRVKPVRALAEAGQGQGEMRGLGALMEGSQTQPLIWAMFFQHAWRSDGYRYDLADRGRQVLADLAGRYHRAILQAYTEKDATVAAQLSGRMLGLLRDLDKLLGTRKEFLLGVWLADARTAGATREEQDRCELGARELLTEADDRAWTQQHDGYPVEARGNTVEISRQLFEKYLADAVGKSAESFGPE